MIEVCFHAHIHREKQQIWRDLLFLYYQFPFSTNFILMISCRLLGS